MAGKISHIVERGGRFWARIVVPAELRPIVGKTELREPLGSDRQEAKRKVHAAVARFLDQFAVAREKLKQSNVVPLAPTRDHSRPLSVRPLAQIHYAEELEIDTRVRNGTYDDGSPVLTGFEILARPAYEEALRKVASGRASNEEIAATIGWAVDKFCDRGNTSVEPGGREWREIARTLASVQLAASQAATERDRCGEANEPTLPILQEVDVVELKPHTTLTAIFDAYFRELQAFGKGTKAERRWRPVFRDLSASLGHEDAGRITKADLIRWKDDLVTRLSPKTIKDVHLAAVRAIFAWAGENGYLDNNPAISVRVRAGRRPRQSREKGFTRAEALAVLKAARDYEPAKSSNPRTRESPKLSAAKRWAPWLCAYTGARITEITQLRKEDVREEDGIHYLRISPEAGSVKSDSFRDVPLHSHLVEIGFLDFVAASETGSLFYNARVTTAATHPAETVSGRISNWIRGLAIVGEDVAPNHGWRHRFKTIGREEGIEERVLNAIQDHASRTAGEDYGDVTLKTKHQALEKFPRYLLS